MAGVTKTANMSNVIAREVDFVTRFGSNWDQLREIMGIMRPIRKTPGTQLVSYKASMADSALATSPAEGVDVTFTTFNVEPVSYGTITVEKYGKAVSVEAVEKYGAEVAVEKTDEAFLTELQNKVMNGFYTFLQTGTLKGSQKTFQRALAVAKGAVLNKFAGMNRTVTDVVAFVNVMDLYEYIGDATLSVQTQFGLQYIKDFMGYSTVFLLPENVLAAGTVIATPVENIDLYYVDPSDSQFAKLGLEYTVDGETNLIGFHTEGNYRNATGESYALMGMTLWAEFLDGICIVTVDSGKANSKPAVNPAS